MKKVQLSNIETQLVQIFLKHNILPESELGEDIKGLIEIIREEQNSINEVKATLSEVISKL